jgi:hypothetical protein
MWFDIFRRGQGREQKDGVQDSDADRPIKFVPDGYNSWRVVWADEKPS